MLQPHNPRIPHPLPRNIDATILGLALRTLNPSLDPRDEVEVAVEGGFGRELAASQVGGWVADP
jgi:hypothetical protein